MATLYVVATPIGNLEDITLRAIRVLKTVPVIACEDTRHTGQLIKTLDREKPPRYLSVRDWNEAQTLEKVLVALQNGDVALVSDAGTPLVSDPGYKVVSVARAAGFKVSPIPGPSAAIAALAAAGLPSNKVIFWGFLPKTWDLQPESTHVIYESPVRLQATLNEIYHRYPQAEVVVAKEMTKIHEEFVNGHAPQTAKGEATIVVYVPDSPHS